MSREKQRVTGKRSAAGSPPGKQELVRLIGRKAQQLPHAQLVGLAAQLGVAPVHALAPAPHGKYAVKPGAAGVRGAQSGGFVKARRTGGKVYINPEVGRSGAQSADEGRSGPGDETLQGAGLQAALSPAEAEARLEERTVDDLSTDWLASEVAGAGDVVKRLRISRATLDNWRKKGWIIAIPKGPRNFVYPLRQFHGLRPVDGLNSVAERFRSPEAAWEWLVIPNRMTYDQAPIDLLHEGEVETVVSAAEGSLDYA